MHKHLDLLALHMQRVEETARDWVSIQQNLTTLKGEVMMMQTVQAELLIMMQ